MKQSRSIPPLSLEVDASRYEIERKLGEGGAGAVYLARDRETGDRIALKKLFRMDAQSVLRLKREFRSLVDIAHPNIVKLYDMGRAGDAWFLTMEYLDGVDLTAYLTENDDAARRTASALSPELVANDNQRVLSTFQQLAHAIQALHQAGMLHRDLKPSNVLVVDGRVVVLDFGLVRELGSQAATVTEDGSIAGTPAYMAPEQMCGSELSEASDWYAFGVILYEALSGVLPIDGTVMEILRRRLDSDPLPLHQVAPGVPRWLNDLCMALLRREPNARPRAAEVVAAFDAGCRVRSRELPRTSTENALPTENDNHAPRLFGRHAELAKLWGAQHDARSGRAVMAHVRGLSGTGKSALVEHFLDELDAQGEHAPLVLRSRCYELEQMPFKALDAVMDALVRHLTHLDDLEVAQLLPHDTGALSRLFPVLERLPAAKRLGARKTPARDAISERQVAEQALRQLLERLAADRPIVLWIDDLQWGDMDSARILRGWLRKPSQCPLLFVFSYRSDEIATSSCLSSLLHLDADGGGASAVEHVIDVSALPSDDIRALCEQRLAACGAADAEVVACIVRESQGSPFLAMQLTALAETKHSRGEAGLESLSIDALVAQTRAILPEQADQLLAVLAVAGRPLTPKLAFHAAGIQHNGRAIVHALRGLNLVRTRDVGGSRMLEVYHDRVRERVQALLGAEQSAAIHDALLGTLEFSGTADPGWLMSLALGAGHRARAYEYGRAAADVAWKSLAFERAAELYRRCIELAPEQQLADLWERNALALARSGHGVKSAHAYLEAAKLGTPERAHQLEQLAASHLLRSGHFERGEALVRQVLAELDASLPESDAGVITAIAWERARLKLRGMQYEVRSAEAAPAQLLRLHDAFESIGSSIQHYDPLRATLLLARSIRYALEAGEPTRIVRVFCIGAINTATSGSARAGAEADELLARAARLADQLPPASYGMVCFARAVCAFMLSRVQLVIAPSLEADRIMREQNLAGDRVVFDYHRRLVSASVRIGAREQLGQMREASQEIAEVVRESEATDNRAMLLTMTLNRALSERADGLGAGTRARLDAHALELPKNRFGILHVLHMCAVMFTATASCDFAWAERHTASLWKHWLRSPIRGSGMLAYMVSYYRALLLLNQHHFERRAGLLDEARRNLKGMEHDRTSAGMPRVSARLALATGERQRATVLLQSAIEQNEARGCLPDAARDRYALAVLVGGQQAAAEQSAALRQLRDCGYVDPDADMRAYYPELTPP